MRSFLRTLALLALPLTILSDTVVPAGTPQEIVPFTTLPLCAQKCGKLFDVQGACTPPVTSTVDNACFCADARLSPFLQSSTLGVCNDACPDDPSGLLNIMKWVNSFCASVSKANPVTTSTATTGTPATATTTATGTAVPGSTGAATQKKTWMDTHWQWIVMVVILFVAFVGGWIAACFFHKRYLRKRELNYEMRPPTAPWVTGHTGPYGGGFGDAMDGGKEATMMTSALPPNVKKEKKKWVVTERT